MITVQRQVRHIEEAYTRHTFTVNELEVLVEETWLPEWLTNKPADHRCTVISVRGTEVTDNFSPIDIIRDLLFFPAADTLNGLAHAGMLSGAHKIADVLVKRYAGLAEFPILLGGHSLGAGVSLLLIKLLQARRWPVRRWVGLGCPRVFFMRAKIDSVELFNYRYGHDLVTYLPPRLMGYAAPVPYIKIGTPARPWPNVSDHAIENYVKQIRLD